MKKSYTFSRGKAKTKTKADNINSISKKLSEFTLLLIYFLNTSKLIKKKGKIMTLHNALN